jgi:hypothetical protein
MLRSWLIGWTWLRHPHPPAAYAALPWASRVVVAHVAALRGLRTPGFWRGLFVATVLAAVLQVVAWRLDLHGAARDLPFFLPAVLLAPRVASARRRLLLRVVRDRRRAEG